MKGDVVPKEDHKYLMKNDAGLYMQATSLKMQNDNPKKHKRLSEDEENGDTSETQSGEVTQTNEASISRSMDIAQEVGESSAE